MPLNPTEVSILLSALQIGFVAYLYPPMVEPELDGAEHRFVLVSGAPAENGQGVETVSIETANNMVFNDILAQLTDAYGAPTEMMEDGTAYWE
jgi:hypothetical protein